MPDPSPFITFGLPALAPMAYVAFVRDHPEDSIVSAGPPIQYSPTVFAQLARVNGLVNQGTDYVPPSSTDAIDPWRILPTMGAVRPKGTCHDYAATKRHLLLKQGFPWHTLLFAIVIAKEAPGQEHCVLVVRTTAGDLVLDSLVPGPPVVWHVRHFDWVSIQSPDDPSRWARVGSDDETTA